MKTIIIHEWMKHNTKKLLVLAFVFAVGITNAQKKATKVSNELINLSQQRKLSAQNLKSGTVQNANSTLPLNGKNNPYVRNEDFVLIHAIAKNSVVELKKELIKLGLKNAASYGGTVSGMLPYNAIDSLSNLKNLRFARQVIKPTSNSGSTLTEGDVAQTSNLLREKFGIKGEGVTIGTLANSFNAKNTTAALVASGDLPGKGNPNGYNKDVVVLEEIFYPEEGTDEGKGMIEILHDIAPAAKLMFHSAYNGEASFAEGIIELAKAGCDIINDDVILHSEPYFQDGIIAQAVDKAVTEYGVEYFSAAGNSGEDSYESEYRPANETTPIYYNGEFMGNYILQDFDEDENSTEYYQELNVKFGGYIHFTFQWDEPFASVCEECPGPETDFDIFLMTDKDPNSTVAFSYNDNIGSGEAFEEIFYDPDGIQPFKVYLVIGKYVDDEAPVINKTNHLKMFNITNIPIEFKDIKTESGTCFGHCNSKHCTSVGEVKWSNTPPFSDKKPTIQFGSSRGGIPIYLDTKGNKLENKEIRIQPKISAPGGGKTASFGTSQYQKEYKRFYGTSAAAPHAAGVAALLKQLKGDRNIESSITELLTSTAIDMDDPNTVGFDTGFDFKTGYGFIQAEKAADSLINQIREKMRLEHEKNTLNNTNKVTFTSIYPNPANDKISINLKSTKEMTVYMKIYSFNGTLSYSKQISILKDDNSFSEMLTDFNKGIYLIKIEDLNGNELAKQKFLKN